VVAVIIRTRHEEGRDCEEPWLIYVVTLAYRYAASNIMGHLPTDLVRVRYDSSLIAFNKASKTYLITKATANERVVNVGHPMMIEAASKVGGMKKAVELLHLAMDLDIFDVVPTAYQLQHRDGQEPPTPWLEYNETRRAAISKSVVGALQNDEYGNTRERFEKSGEMLAVFASHLKTPEVWGQVQLTYRLYSTDRTAFAIENAKSDRATNDIHRMTKPGINIIENAFVERRRNVG
jgi:hypothetical protein